MANNNAHKENDMTYDDFETQIHPEESNEYFDYVSGEDFEAELRLAADVEENYEHGDHRDELVQDEIEFIDEQRITDTVDEFDFDDVLASLAAYDEHRDVDFLDS